MDTTFNKKAAELYDKTFTNGDIGKLQREKVHVYLGKYLKNKPILNILELNCGTGVDAAFFVNLGHRILATDSSSHMLKITQHRLGATNRKGTHKTQLLDLKKPKLDESGFDLVFSNFGGLNCLSTTELKLLANFVSDKLKPNGTFIAVVMPPHTMIEKWYRTFKGERSIYENRSSSQSTPVNVNGKNIHTYYFEESEIRNTFKDYQHIATQSMSYIPSYFETSKLKGTLLAIDSLLYTFNLNPNKSDHYLVHLEKSKTL